MVDVVWLVVAFGVGGIAGAVWMGAYTNGAVQEARATISVARREVEAATKAMREYGGANAPQA